MNNSTTKGKEMTPTEQRFYDECYRRFELDLTPSPAWDSLDYATTIASYYIETREKRRNSNLIAKLKNKMLEIEAEFDKYGWYYNREESKKFAVSLGLLPPKRNKWSSQ